MEDSDGFNKQLWNTIFEYRDGELYWKVAYSRRIKVGEKAGTVRNKYKAIEFSGRKFYTHRVIYEMFFGEIENNLQIDHIDRNPLNNHIENLRLVNNSENQSNQSFKGNTSGHKYITWNKTHRKWHLQFRINGKNYNFGYFEDLELAILKRNTLIESLGKTLI
jgi:hypothetical protein